jgi:Flp pilus assembly protein CpaB
MRWPSFRRKLPMGSKVLFGLAAALALTSFLVVGSEVARAERAQAAAGPGVTVVVAARDVAAGTTLQAGDVRTVAMPLVYAPPAAVTSPDAAIGRVLDGPVAACEVLVDTRLATSAFAPSVTPGYVVVTVGFASVPDGLSTADRVDAFATYAGARPYTTLVGEDLHIVSITQREAAFDGSDATSVTLDVDPETARQLLQAAASATLGLAARAPITETPSAGASATPEVTQPPG